MDDQLTTADIWQLLRKPAEAAACLAVLAAVAWPEIAVDDFWRVVSWLGL